MRTTNYLIQKSNRMAWMLMGPLVVYFLIFSGFPVAFALLLGFLKWVGITVTPTFAGIANFKRVLTDKMYLTALWNSFFIGGLLMCVNIVLGFFGAFFPVLYGRERQQDLCGLQRRRLHPDLQPGPDHHRGSAVLRGL